jgi:hypothetical protein
MFDKETKETFDLYQELKNLEWHWSHLDEKGSMYFISKKNDIIYLCGPKGLTKSRFDNEKQEIDKANIKILKGKPLKNFYKELSIKLKTDEKK